MCVLFNDSRNWLKIKFSNNAFVSQSRSLLELQASIKINVICSVKSQKQRFKNNFKG